MNITQNTLPGKCQGKRSLTIAEANEQDNYFEKGKDFFRKRDDKEKKRIFKKGKNLGKKMLKENPGNQKIKYWYMVNLGRWGHSIGVMKAIKKNIANFVLYAQALKEVGRQEEAVNQLKSIIDCMPRENDFLPDKYYLQKAHSLLAQWQ